MKKYLAITFFVLTIAIVTNYVIVEAATYPSPVGTSFSKELDKNQAQYTFWRTKTNYSRQTYENLDTFTKLTDPCPNCKIGAKPFLDNGDFHSGIVTTLGHVGKFSSTSSTLGNYRLSVWRVDATLLTTYHSALWTMNSNN